MKNNDDIFRRLINNSTIDEVQAELNAELEKSEPDYNKVAELTAIISELSENSIDDKQIQKNIAEINEAYNAENKRSKIKCIYKWISALSACLIIVFSLNIYTMVSFGENIFTTVVELTKSGFSIDFSKNPDPSGGQAQTTTLIPITTTMTTLTKPAAQIATGTNIYTSAESSLMRPVEEFPTTTTQATTVLPPSGSGELANIGGIMMNKCETAGVVPCFLNYYTDMKLSEFSFDENELSTDCYFTFSDDDSQLDIIVEQYNNNENIPPVLIPSEQDSYNIISGLVGDIYIFEEDSHTTAVFIYKNTVYTAVGHNIPPDEMENIITKYYPYEQN